MRSERYICMLDMAEIGFFVYMTECEEEKEQQEAISNPNPVLNLPFGADDEKKF